MSSGSSPRRNPARRGVAAAIALYCIFGFALIAQKPGLQYDEALLVSGGLHMAHSAAPFELDDTPDAWVCPFHHCVPLMAFLYVGSAKEFANLPFFAVFGGRASLIRLVALAFGVPAIWGLAMLIETFFGPTEAVIAALALAINPGFLNMLIFDNGANGGIFAGLGLTCAFLAIYIRRESALAAFGLGMAMGFGVWSRANFVWLLVAGGFAALVVFRRRILIPASHFAAIAVGGIVSGFPFLLYQIVSGGATWKAQSTAPAAPGSMALLLHQRIYMFADSLLSDVEHRAMWNGPPLPAWQLWLFPCLVLAACLVCLFWRGRGDLRRRKFAQFLALTFAGTGALLFTSRYVIAEHHLVLLTPLALSAVVVACSLLASRFRGAWLLSAALLTIYASSAVYWQVESVRGLGRTGGTRMWSNGVTELAGYLDQNFRGRDIKLVDWGLGFNLYVLTDGRLRPRSIYAPESTNVSASGRPWSDEIRDGGVFVLNGPDNRVFPQPSAGFLRALAAARPETQVHNIEQRNGSVYAEVVAVTPESMRKTEPADDTPEIRIPMDSTEYDSRLTAFYQPESGGVRWTARQFSALLPLAHLSNPGGAAVQLVVQFYLPEVSLRTLGPLTLRTVFAGHALAPETWSDPGVHFLRRPLDNTWLAGHSDAEINFSLDKAMPPSSSDKRELGIMVKEISVGPDEAH